MDYQATCNEYQNEVRDNKPLYKYVEIFLIKPAFKNMNLITAPLVCIIVVEIRDCVLILLQRRGECLYKVRRNSVQWKEMNKSSLLESLIMRLYCISCGEKV